MFIFFIDWSFESSILMVCDQWYHIENLKLKCVPAVSALLSASISTYGQQNTEAQVQTSQLQQIWGL